MNVEQTTQLSNPQFLDNINAENTYICSPNSNFTFEQRKTLSNLYEKTDICGTETYNLIGMVEGEVKLAELPVYCNNRSCTNPDCKEHRKYLYMRNHLPQINHLKDNIDKPKAYVFTGYNIDIRKGNFDQIKKFCRSKLQQLYILLADLSRTEFSVHMEIKLYPKHHKKYGIAWLHFHVISGFIDVTKARSRWKRVVKYEEAIKFTNLEKYISKYASKTPYFQEEIDRQFYHLIVYKTQMHRYSMALKECEQIKRQQTWYLEDLLEKELLNSYKREHYREHSFTPYYDNFTQKLNQDKPPPKNQENDIPACVYVYPNFAKKKTTKPKKPIKPEFHLNVLDDLKTYPHSYLCINSGCGLTSTTKPCEHCGGKCID